MVISYYFIHFTKYIACIFCVQNPPHPPKLHNILQYRPPTTPGNPTYSQYVRMCKIRHTRAKNATRPLPSNRNKYKRPHHTKTHNTTQKQHSLTMINNYKQNHQTRNVKKNSLYISVYFYTSRNRCILYFQPIKQFLTSHRFLLSPTRIYVNRSL
jgi:hypothetical protein